MRQLKIQFGLESQPRTIYIEQLGGIATRIMEKQKLTSYDLEVIKEVLAACVSGNLINSKE